MSITLFGIRNCDTVKKARSWLDKQALDYAFHDFRSDGLNAQQVRQWAQNLGPAALINRRSTTWKQLNDEQQALLGGDTLSEDAIALIVERPTLIKRPVLQYGQQVTVGFKETIYQEILI